MEQKFPHPKRVFIENISLFIRIDVHTINIHLPLINTNKCFLDAAFSHTDRFHLCAKQFDSCLILILYKIIMVCLFIVGNQFDGLFSHTKFLPFYPSASLKSTVLVSLSVPATSTRTFWPSLYLFFDNSPTSSMCSSSKTK